jgi:hypothetical protein
LAAVLTAAKKSEGAMAEAMTVETIVEADWQMQGFWTRVRFPFKTPKGDWADVDVLAYHPEQRKLVIAESKVREPKKDIYAFTSYTQSKYGSILEYDEDNYFSFLRHVGTLCVDGLIFEDFGKMVKTLVVQLVSNYYITNDVRPDAEKVVLGRIQKQIPAGVNVEIRLETTLDVISRIIQSENTREQGRRYGHAVIDIAREINRYMHPHVKYAGKSEKNWQTSLSLLWE